VTNYYVSQLAYLAAKLDAMPEGTHGARPLVRHVQPTACGPAAGTTRTRSARHGRRPRWHSATGRVLDYLGRSDDDRKLCSLYLSLMDRMDVHVDRFGDAETRLAGI